MQTRKKRRNKYAAPIGGLFVALALIGIITVVFFSIDLTGKVLDNSNEKQKLEKLLLPVVMFDPVPFESPADLDMQQILLYSMWSNLGSEQRLGYSYNEVAELMVPASDLDVAAGRLFGPDVVLEHQTFNDYQTTYYYDDKVYYVPTTAQLYVYTPRVEEITQEQKGIFHVTVGYIPPQGNAWTTDFSGNKVEPSAEKEMVYVMQKNKGEYHILALLDPPAEIIGDTPTENPK